MASYPIEVSPPQTPSPPAFTPKSLDIHQPPVFRKNGWTDSEEEQFCFPPCHLMNFINKTTGRGMIQTALGPLFCSLLSINLANDSRTTLRLNCSAFFGFVLFVMFCIFCVVNCFGILLGEKQATNA